MVNRIEKILEHNRCKSHTIQQTSNELGIPIASVHRIFKVLRNLGWIMEDGLVWDDGNRKRRAKAYLSTIRIQRMVR